MSRNKILLILSTLLVILYFFPLALGYIPLKGVLYIGFPFIAFILYPQAFYNKQTFWLVVGIVIWSALLLLRGDSERFSWFQKVYLYWLNALSLHNLYVFKQNTKILKKHIPVIFVFILVSLLMSLPIAIKDPMIIRLTLADVYRGVPGADINLTKLQRIGMVEYTYIHALPSMFPLFYMFFKHNNRKKRFWGLFFMVLFFFFVIKTSFGAVLILSIFSVVLLLISTHYLRKNVIRLVVISVFLLPMLNNDVLIWILNELMPLFEGTIITDKFNDIILSLSYDTRVGQIEGRGGLYDLSWMAFLESPIFGSAGDGGGHAMIIDFLGWFGIVGTIPLLLFLYYIFKSAYLRIDPAYKYYYLLALMPYVILSFVKGTSGFFQLYIITTMIPGALILFANKESTRKRVLKNIIQ
jgi:hypothetical protein